MSKFYYYIDNQGKQCGPVEKDRLAALGVTGDTYVWAEGMADWKHASEVSDISYLLPTPPSAPATPPNTPAPGYGATQTYNSPVEPAESKPYQPHYAGDEVPPEPQSYLWLGILTTILCCLPLGIVSIVKAAKCKQRYARGMYEESYAYSRSAKLWGIWSAIIGFILIAAYVIFFIILAKETSSHYNYYDSYDYWY